MICIVFIFSAVMLSRYLDCFSRVAYSTILPYRYFLHWSLHKMALFIYATIGGIVLSIPFLIGVVAVYYRLQDRLTAEVIRDITLFAAGA